MVGIDSIGPAAGGKVRSFGNRLCASDWQGEVPYASAAASLVIADRKSCLVFFILLKLPWLAGRYSLRSTATLPAAKTPRDRIGTHMIHAARRIDGTAGKHTSTVTRLQQALVEYRDEVARAERSFEDFAYRWERREREIDQHLTLIEGRLARRPAAPVLSVLSIDD